MRTWSDLSTPDPESRLGALGKKISLSSERCWGDYWIDPSMEVWKVYAASLLCLVDVGALVEHEAYHLHLPVSLA